MSLSLNYPTVRPTLLLDFINTDQIDPRITFSRASSATYFNSNGILTTAATNALRRDYNPSTLAPQGFLVEEQRTNLLPYSEQFDNAVWGPIAGTVTANATTAPSGAVTADRGVTNGVNFQVIQGATITSGATVSGSVFLKADGINEVELVLLASNNTTPYGRATFNVSTGVISTAASSANGGTNVSASITAINNGWYRCVVTVTYPATTSAGMRINAPGATGGIFLWGAQLEAGAFPTSYIPTTTTALTRALDLSVVTTSPWFNATEGTFYAESLITYSAGTQFPAPFSVSASGASTNQIMAYYLSTNRVDFYVRTGGTVVADIGPTFTANTINKFAGAYKENDFAATNNGAAVSTDTSGALPSGINQLNLGAQAGGASGVLNGYLRRLTYYSRRLSNAELQAITV